MKLPLQITFRDMPHSDAVEALIRERVARIERQHPRMMACRVTVHEPHRRQSQGRMFAISIDASLPGIEVAVGRDGYDKDPRHQDIRLVVRDAFDALARQLRAAVELQRHEVKTHSRTQKAPRAA